MAAGRGCSLRSSQLTMLFLASGNVCSIQREASSGIDRPAQRPDESNAQIRRHRHGKDCQPRLTYECRQIQPAIKNRDDEPVCQRCREHYQDCRGQVEQADPASRRANCRFRNSSCLAPGAGLTACTSVAMVGPQLLRTKGGDPFRVRPTGHWGTMRTGIPSSSIPPAANCATSLSTGCTIDRFDFFVAPNRSPL